MESYQQEKQTLKQYFLGPFPISNWYDSLFHIILQPVQTLRQYTNFQSFSTNITTPVLDAAKYHISQHSVVHNPHLVQQKPNAGWHSSILTLNYVF